MILRFHQQIDLKHCVVTERVNIVSESTINGEFALSGMMEKSTMLR